MHSDGRRRPGERRTSLGAWIHVAALAFRSARHATPCNIGGDHLRADSAQLNEKQALAIEMLAAGKWLSLVTETPSLDLTTLWRWRQDEPFRPALHDPT